MPACASHPERIVRVAVLQAGTDHSKAGNPGSDANFALLAQQARSAACASPDLIVFPEYTIPGWPYPPEAEINALAEPIPGHGPWYRRYVALAQETGCALLCSLVEKAGDKLYNGSFLLDPGGEFVGRYRKVQANLGEQTWWGWSQGESFAPIWYDGVRYGVSICADMWFPETVRCEALLGADLIVHQSIADDMGHIIPARAFDDEVPIAASVYNGGSYAVDSRGVLMGKLATEPPGWQVFEFRPFKVRTQRKYGGLWVPKLGTRNLRNVDAYSVLVDPSTRPPWTDVFLDTDGRPQTREQLLNRFGGRYDVRDPAPHLQAPVSFGPPWTSSYAVDPDWPFHLVNDEGEHLFIVNKTAWAYFGCRDPLGVIERAREQGVNVLRVALEGVPYWDHLGIDMWPWGGTRQHPVWTAFDETYWQQVEDRIRLAGEHGIGLDLVLYFSLHPNAGDVAAQRPYWQMALSRLAKYTNVLTWEIANEYVKNEAFQDAAGTYFRRNDPHRCPVCTSDGTTDDAVWPDKPWVDLAVNHTCTSSTARHPLREWYLALARNTRGHGKPAFCNESGRESRHQNDDGVHRRKQGWLWCAAGGFWTWHAWDGCEGIDEPEYRAPGWQYVKPMAELFRSIPFWTLHPNHTALAFDDDSVVSAVLCDAERSLAIGYACVEQTGRRYPDGKAQLRLYDGAYRVTFLDPADLSTIGSLTHTSLGLRKPVEIEVPAFTDDLAIQIARLHEEQRITIPGTE